MSAGKGNFMQRNFYFFRHGETNENEVGIRYGDGIDAWLTKSGTLQAEKLSEFFKDKAVDVVYSSPYKRSIDTAKLEDGKWNFIESFCYDAKLSSK